LSVDKPDTEPLSLSCAWRCGVCSAVCKVGAIGYSAGEVRVDMSRCSGCMVCAMVCPAGILEEASFV
jgi:Fe-S-cluster-containing hydrogenase component 2